MMVYTYIPYVYCTVVHALYFGFPAYMYVCYELPQIYSLTEYNSPKIEVALITKGTESNAVLKSMYSFALSIRNMGGGNFSCDPAHTFSRPE